MSNGRPASIFQTPRKIDRTRYDHDPEAVEVRACDVTAGDLVPGLGIVEAILSTGRVGGHLVLCVGEHGLEVVPGEPVTVHPAICPDCDMHPLDCRYYGCEEGRETDLADPQPYAADLTEEEG